MVPSRHRERSQESQAVAAAVIGGGSLRGGERSAVGTLIGAVIILAATVDELRKRKLTRAYATQTFSAANRPSCTCRPLTRSVIVSS